MYGLDGYEPTNRQVAAQVEKWPGRRPLATPQSTLIEDTFGPGAGKGFGSCDRPSRTVQPRQAKRRNAV